MPHQVPQKSLQSNYRKKLPTKRKINKSINFKSFIFKLSSEKSIKCRLKAFDEEVKSVQHLHSHRLIAFHSKLIMWALRFCQHVFPLNFSSLDFYHLYLFFTTSFLVVGVCLVVGNFNEDVRWRWHIQGEDDTLLYWTFCRLFNI